jgi:probable lipoprotein NlpC
MGQKTMGGFLALAALLAGGAAALAAAPLEEEYALDLGTFASAEEKAAVSRELRLRVLSAADKYEKTPYRYNGLDRNGLDCSGLIYLSFRDALGVTVPRSSSGLHAWAEKIPTEKIQPGDLLFFTTDNTGRISHSAIYAGGGRFIHSASDGPRTGVIYSRLDERYWASHYAGAGRAFPEADFGEARDFAPGAAAPEPAAPGTVSPGAGGAVRPARPGSSRAKKPGRFMMGFALAPSWNGFYEAGDALRGFASQFRLGLGAALFNRSMIFGVELRPEWDAALGVFRLPLTLSWGFDDRLRFFLGPVLSAGSAELHTAEGTRRYRGGTSVIGAVGITAAPLIFPLAGGELAPCVELAWQSYLSENAAVNLNADLAAGFRFSTGIRYTWKFR